MADEAAHARSGRFVRSEATQGRIRPAGAGLDPLASLIGRSAAMNTLREALRHLAMSRVPVLITGESGTGKEVCAQAIAGLWGHGPPVILNCAAIPRELAESELFGHEKGAFTGALAARSGLIERADGRILFLDEIGELAPEIQAKLLRTLETGEYRPVGSTETRHASFRTLAATSNQDRLLPQLLHRIAAARLWLPPLRARLEDVPMLVSEFLRRARETNLMGPRLMEPAAIGLLMAEPWPGNVRQLRNVVEVSAAWAGSASDVRVEDVVQVLRMQQPPAAALSSTPLTLAQQLEHAAQHAIAGALATTGGNRARAAALLGMSQASLYRKLKRLGDDIPRRNAGSHA